MIFLKLNDGRKVNMLHISQVRQEGQNVLYSPARNSLEDIIEHFPTEDGAETRYEQVKNLIKVEVEE